MPAFNDQLTAGDIEHGTTRLSRWLRARWITLGAWIALAEGILILMGELSKTIAVVVALAFVAIYFSVDRSKLSPDARIGARILALSQVLVVFVPIMLFVLKLAAIVALALILVIAVFALLRKHL